MAPESPHSEPLELSTKQAALHAPAALALGLQSLAGAVEAHAPVPSLLRRALSEGAQFVEAAGWTASGQARTMTEQVLRRITIDGDTPLFAVGEEGGERVVQSLYDGDARALALALWLSLTVTHAVGVGSHSIEIDPRLLPEEIRPLMEEAVGILSGLGIKARPFVRH